MVKTVIGTCLLLLFAVPALAQDDFPRLEFGFGYSNIGVDISNAALFGVPENSIIFGVPITGDFTSGRHSGFAQQTGLNITKWFGIENYFGYYSLGNGANLIANTFGGKVMYRTDKAVPYAVAELGGAGISLSDGSGTGSLFATRLGGGVDIAINDSMSWKVDISRLPVHLNGVWYGKMNFTTGILLKMSF